MEDDLYEPQEGVEIEGQAENQKRQGHVEDAKAKIFDDSKLEDHSQEELKVTEKEELTEDDLEGAGRCREGNIESGRLFTNSREQL